jgi:hypothetical protein
MKRLGSILALVATVHVAAVPVLAQPPRPSGQAQPAGTDLVTRGRTLFDDQQYEESIQTLSAALVRPSNTRAQKIEILHVLALDYIALGRKEEAEGAVRGLLAIEPEYQLPEPSPRFVEFFSAVKTKWEAEGRPGLVKETEPPPSPVAMRHSSPSQADAGSAISLSATLDDPGGRVTLVKLFYRSGSEGKFSEIDAAPEAGKIRATIPGSDVKPPLVEYYFQGFDKAGLPIVSRGDATAPLRVAIPEANKGWVLPVVIGGGVLGAAAITLVFLAAAGVFKSSSGGTTPAPTTTGTTPPPPPNGNATVTVTIGPSSWRK